MHPVDRAIARRSTRLRRAARLAHHLSRVYAGARVVVFPEGTTSDGTTVGHFHPALFQSAIDARAPVQPVALRYRDAHGEPSPAPVFVGDTTVLESVGHVIREPSLTVEVTFG